MNLWQRYKRLTIWNKFGVWSGIFTTIGLLFTVWCYVITLPESSDYVALHRPNIDVALAVDSFSTNGIRYHFTVHNVGQVQAENLVFIEIGPAGSRMNPLPEQHRCLCPGGRMKYRPILFPDDKPLKDGHLIVEFTVGYEASLKSKKRPFSQHFRWCIPVTDIHVGDFLPDRTTASEVALDQAAQQELAGLPDILDTKSGTFWFCITLPRNMPTNDASVILNSKTTTLIYDPIHSMIFWVHITDRSNALVAGIKIHNATNGPHWFVLGWSPTNGYLGVDRRYEDAVLQPITNSSSFSAFTPSKTKQTVSIVSSPTNSLNLSSGTNRISRSRPSLLHP